MRREELTPGFTHKLSSAPITTTQLVKYAGASGDFNRIHFDAPFATAKGLPGVLAHGMLTMAIAGRCVDEVAGNDARIAEFSARFLSPVFVGDTVEAVATVVEGGEGGTVLLELVASVGEKTVLEGRAVLDHGA